MKRIISLGAGVQSTTLALMAAHGELTPMPDCAIFADTQWEPAKVYEHLRWLMSPNVLPFPVHIVSSGNIRQAAIDRTNTTGQKFAAIPWFTRSLLGTEGMGRRQCTREYKLTPIQRKARELLGGKTPRAGVEMWIGISLDEAARMKPSRVAYIVNRWPLIEKRINRRECLAWLARNGYPTPPKSSCIGCPFHSDAQWRALKDGPPEEWKDALAVDAAIREQSPDGRIQFMHHSLKPLAEVDLRTDAEAGQPDLFQNECEGMCGV